MAFDVAKWLREDFGFSEEDAASLEGKFGPKADVLEKGYLRQSDYSRQMNVLTKAQTDLKAQSDQLNKDIAEWGELTAAEKHDATELRNRIEKAEAEKFQLQQRITRLAEEAGRDPKELLGDVEPVKPKEAPAFDPADVNRRIAGATQWSMRVTAALPRIMREHRELTGQELDTEAFIASMEADLNSGKAQRDPSLLDPVKRWEAQFEIGQKRDAKRTADIDQRVAAAREEGMAAARSEAALPNAGTVGRSESSSTVFRTLGQSKLSRPAPGDKFAGARAAISGGKYRNAGPGGVMPADAK